MLTDLEVEWSITSSMLKNISCEALFNGDEAAATDAKRLTFNDSVMVDAILNNSDRCRTIQRLFGFFPTLSDEERDFPIAYAMLVNKDVAQVLMLLSAIFQPQNQFCIAVDGKSDKKFWHVISELATCYPNIQVFKEVQEISQASNTYGKKNNVNTKWGQCRY
ncbi:hypothetical protein RB195_005323 [Necator americanus]|uniref:MULE transposase domain-containing protein n=1 Tax=Necator americanus TaxID=51031 RepID=A0ABR1BM92_NECAM